MRVNGSDKLSNDGNQGFTMMELIMVIVLVGILAVVIAPRWVGQVEFDARGFTDQTLGMLRYAQKVAIAQRRDVWVQIDQTSGNICLTYNAVDANCLTGATIAATPANQVLDPVNRNWFKKTAPKNVSFATSFSFRFTGLGRPNPNSSQTVVIIGGATPATIIIESETGYVH